MQRLKRLARTGIEVCQDAIWAISHVKGNWLTFFYDTFVERIPNLIPGFTYPVKDRRIELRDGTVLFYRTNKSDLYVFREVFMWEVYRLPEGLRPSGALVDLGANIGMASVWLSRTYDIDGVIAVEPVPTNAAILQKNLEVNSISNKIIHAAVGPRRGTVSFSTHERPGEGHVAEDGASDFVVSMVTMEDVLKDVDPVALVKMDIEGGEGPLIYEGSPEWLNDVPIIAAELHKEYLDVAAMTNAICDFGFSLVPPADRAYVGTSEWVFVRSQTDANTQLTA